MAITMIRTIILYTLVVICLRIMGKRQIGELQPSELVVAIMVSDLATIPMQDTEIPIVTGIIPIFTLVIMEVYLSYISTKSKKFSHFVCGTPSIVIKDGEIVDEEMKKLRFSRDDLLEELRISGCFDITQVEYAILETNGGLGLIMKPEHRPITVAEAKELFAKKEK